MPRLEASRCKSAPSLLISSSAQRHRAGSFCPDRFLKLLEILFQDAAGDPQARIGIAPHSLRAVTPETLKTVLAGLKSFDTRAPIHIHIAEQVKEVEDCLAWSGNRPVDWLYDNFAADCHWCLIHATHMTAEETARLANSGAVAGLCPTTEANLGDGLFPAIDYFAQDGAWGIGSDSHISISPLEELRWLEYGQRLIYRGRNLLGPAGEGHSVGAALYSDALFGGAQALGRRIGKLESGSRADLVVLDLDLPCLLGKSGDLLLDAAVFAGNLNPVRDVMVDGSWVVQEGRHRDEETVLQGFRGALGF